MSALDASDNHFLAIELSYFVFAFGDNGDGQLGNGTTTASLTTPVYVPGIPEAVSIAAGDNHSLALASDGSVWSWGSNNTGQVGDGTTVDRLSPVKVAEAGFAWKAATPVMSPLGGSYTATQSVTMTSSTSGATIHYTTDGSTPTGSSTTYSSAVSVTATTTLRAIAVKSGLSDSNVTGNVYTLQVATPTLSPGTATYSSSQTVTVSCSVSGATIHYTTNGNEPTESDATVASGSTVSVTQSQVLKAKAFKSGWLASGVGTATYTLKPATPSLSPSGGSYSTSQSVTVNLTTTGATIHYTLDGLEPTELDATVAAGASVTVASSATLKAKAFKTGWTPSDTGSGTFVLDRGAAAAPTLLTRRRHLRRRAIRECGEHDSGRRRALHARRYRPHTFFADRLGPDHDRRHERDAQGADATPPTTARAA